MDWGKEMTKNSKEKIIIDGVDVSECAIYRSSQTRTLCCSGIYCKEQQFYNCYFKQLKRKEQECEEHRRNAEIHSNDYINICIANGKTTLKMLEYKQALDEIEKKCCAVLNGDEKILYAYQIKEIIKKAKDGE